VSFLGLAREVGYPISTTGSEIADIQPLAIREFGPMTYSVTAGLVDSQSIAVVRLRGAQADLPVVIPDACGQVRNFLRSNKIAGAGRNVAVYLDDQINIECGVEAPAGFVSDGVIFLSATPTGFAARVAHFGPDHLLGQAHKAILA